MQKNRLTQQTMIRHVIEDLYGPCPRRDFASASSWANAIDWERVKAAVEAHRPEFRWNHPNPKDMDVAEAMILDVRNRMLRQSGHETKK